LGPDVKFRGNIISMFALVVVRMTVTWKSKLEFKEYFRWNGTLFQNFLETYKKPD